MHRTEGGEKTEKRSIKSEESVESKRSWLASWPGPVERECVSVPERTTRCFIPTDEETKEALGQGGPRS